MTTLDREPRLHLEAVYRANSTLRLAGTLNLVGQLNTGHLFDVVYDEGTLR